MVVYSVHNLFNLPVRKFGPLDRCSCFPFESFSFKLKCLVRRPNLPLQQIIRRLSERKVNLFYARLKTYTFNGGILKNNIRMVYFQQEDV